MDTNQKKAPPLCKQATTFSDGNVLAQCETLEETIAYLKTFAVWTLRDLALFLNVDHPFYRRNILPLPTHPSAINPDGKNLAWWSAELCEWLSDPANMKRRKAA